MLIEFLLACSPVLQTFTLDIHEEVDADAKMTISRKVMQFNKSLNNNIFFHVFMTTTFDDAQTAA